MKIVQKSVIFFLCILLIGLTTCTAKNQIVGSWKDRISGSIFEFKKDGTLAANMLVISIDGKYSFIDNNTIKLDLSSALGAAGQQTYTYKLNNNVLTLTMGSTVMVFDRVKVK